MTNRKKERFEEPRYWQSYSDMMAALLLVFILIIAVTLSVYKEKRDNLEVANLQLEKAQHELLLSQEELEASKIELELSMEQLEDANATVHMTKEELDAAYLAIDKAQEELRATKSQLEDIVGIRTDIIGELQNRFANSAMKVDEQTGSITFSSDVLFHYNSANLTTESQETLKECVPLYLGVLLQSQFRPYIAEIIIEGHTDTKGDYQSNMTLSYNRANSVARFCLDSKNGLNETQIEQLQKILTINGRSWSNPIYMENSTEVDMDASRRVEIKFRLKEDEMIEKITEVLDS